MALYEDPMFIGSDECSLGLFNRSDKRQLSQQCFFETNPSSRDFDPRLAMGFSLFLEVVS